MTNQMEDKVRDLLQIILSTAENCTKEIKFVRDTGAFLHADLERIAEKTRELEKLLFGGKTV